MIPPEIPAIFIFSGPIAAAGSFIEETVQSATGLIGLLVIAIYSFLIAWILPLPSELVLGAAATLNLGLGTGLTLAVIIVVSGAGKALGSLFAFYIGQEAKEYGPLVRFLERSRFDIVEWSERTTASIAQQYGYVGMALVLCVPGFPDTLSIYAFSLLEDNYVKFALATFVGSMGRLVVFLGLVRGVFILF